MLDRVWSSFLQDWRGKGGGGEEERGDESKEKEEEEEEEGMKATEERGSGETGEWRRGDKASGTDRDMNNLSTLLMDRLGEKMKRDGARERKTWWGGGRERGSEPESRGRGGIK